MYVGSLEKLIGSQNLIQDQWIIHPWMHAVHRQSQSHYFTTELGTYQSQWPFFLYQVSLDEQWCWACHFTSEYSCSSEAGAKTVCSLNGLMCFLIKFTDQMDRPACLSLADSDAVIDKRECVEANYMWHLTGQSRGSDCFSSLPVTFHTESWVNNQNKDTSLSPMCLLILLCLNCLLLNSWQTYLLHKKHVFVLLGVIASFLLS